MSKQEKNTFGINRRGLMKSAGASLGVLAMPRLLRAQDKGEVIISTTAGLMENSLIEHFYGRFEQETGIRVRSVGQEIPQQWARVIAGARNNQVPFDVVNSSVSEMYQYADYLAPIPCDDLPGIVEHALPGSCNVLGLLRTVGSMLLTWNKAAFPNGAPSNWAEFWDVETFPGARALPDTGERDWWVPTIALMADGVPRDELFPLDLDRAYAKLDELRPYIAAWWKSGDNAMQIMRGGEAVATLLYSSRAVPLAKTGEFDFTWNQSLRDIGNWSILKGSPNPQNALAFLDFFVQNPEEHLQFSAKLSFDSNNKEAAAMLPESERRYRPSLPANYDQQIVADFAWIAANREVLRERWVSWLTK